MERGKPRTLLNGDRLPWGLQEGAPGKHVYLGKEGNKDEMGTKQSESLQAL